LLRQFQFVLSTLNSQTINHPRSVVRGPVVLYPFGLSTLNSPTIN